MGEKTKILIIDDDEEVRTLYSEVFRKEGFEVIEAFDGQDGLEKASSNYPHIIFTGIDMPRMTGFQLKEALSKDESAKDIPVIMSSHRGRPEDLAKAKEMGMKDFIVLGMTPPKQVVEKVKSLFRSGYQIKIDPSQLDAYELAESLGVDDNFRCRNCGSELVMNVEILDKNSLQLSGQMTCPKCGN